MNITSKINKLREKFKSYNIDGFLIPSHDEFQSEYTPDHLNRLKFITNFSGSNGLAVITSDRALFFTDGRYLLQATQELDNIFEIHNLSYLFTTLPKIRLGYDPKLHSSLDIERYKDFNMVACDNLIDLPYYPKPSTIFEYPIKYAGETSEDKCQDLQNYLQEKEIDAIIITDSTNICWLLNIRAHDVQYNPILLSFLIFHQDGSMELFSNAKNSYPLSELPERIKLLKHKKVQLDPNSASIWLKRQFTNPILLEDPCLLKKSCKNKIEINQAKKIHIIDGLAVTRLLYWLEENYQDQSELAIAQKLLEFRQANKRFIYPSFTTISAFAENGAIIHYSPKEETNKAISGDGLYLLDSGGQYWGGTTDITRVIPIGKASNQQKIDFTLVLKGHIALASAIFPKSTTGADLDVLARYYLWQMGKDYAHGTGHGVGNALSVHEGPQRISKHSKTALKPGMIISNEPGFYKNGEYGIRIENLMLVKELSNDFLAMETLSLAPIEKRLILPKMLSQREKKWLNTYHKKVYNKLSPFLSGKELLWLKSRTAIL